MNYERISFFSLKGCSVHCPWCSNPENISFEKQPIRRRNDTGMNTEKEYGVDYKPEILTDILIKDRKFRSAELFESTNPGSSPEALQNTR